MADQRTGNSRKACTYIIDHDLSRVRGIEEMPVPEHGIPELTLSLGVDGVDVKIRVWSPVSDVEEHIGDEPIGMIVCQA